VTDKVDRHNNHWLLHGAVRYLAEHGQQLLHDGGALARVALEGHAQHPQGGAVQGAEQGAAGPRGTAGGRGGGGGRVEQLGLHDR
jgi:hypothetical protein